MINYFIWMVVTVLYIPVLKVFYAPVINGLTTGPVEFLEAFGKPWGDIADYTHAYFIFPISLWLVWRRRIELKELIQNQTAEQKKSIFAFLVLLIGLLIFNFGWWQDYDIIYAFSIIPVLYGLTSFLYGFRVSNSISFPIFYLIFLVPPTAPLLDAITLPMRYGISVVTEILLGLLNYPVTRDGLLLTIGYSEIFMGQPCSGFRSLITMFSLVLVYVYISKGNLTKKIIMTSSIVPLALLGNLIRVTALCLITYYFGEEAGQGFFHDFSGIVVFVITVLGVLSIEMIIDSVSKRRSLAENGA